MAGSLNRVFLIGHLGADPEVRTFQNGGRVANLRIATSESWKDKNTGERRERTEWHTVVIHADGLVGIAEKYLRKGSKVHVTGRLETRKWQAQDGADRWSTEITLRPYDGELILLDRRPDGQGGGGDGGGMSYGAPSGGGGAAGQGAGGRDFDDDIPF